MQASTGNQNPGAREHTQHAGEHAALTGNQNQDAKEHTQHMLESMQTSGRPTASKRSE